MPVFQENAFKSRDLRVLPLRELPLPRLTPRAPPVDDGVEKHEVVVIGAGPAGMMATLLLARYGLGKSLKCYDAKPGTLLAGQADGLQPRTLEVLKSLDIVDEIMNHSCHMSEVAFWNPKSHGSGGAVAGIERTSFAPDVVVPARYKHEITIHQGRIERIMKENLENYAADCMQHSTSFLGYENDGAGDSEYPLKVKLEEVNGEGEKVRRIVRSKYLIGADGAHSNVRRCMGLRMTGETTDHIWGVVDFVSDTNFPDVRKRCAIHSDAGSVMIIPRERIYSGQYLTRLYVQMKEEVSPEEPNPDEARSRVASTQRRSAITLPVIMQQAQRVFEPYTIDIKAGTEVDWWAAYQIGQRIATSFSAKGDDGQERIFIAGDACHTHSPKAGQGMNVSMMDSYNLAWKLAHKIHGLSPDQDGHGSILATYATERAAIAKSLIEFDAQFSSMFSGQIGADSSVEGLTHEQFLKVFSDGNGFTSGCGIEYAAGPLVQQAGPGTKYPITGDDYLQGVLRPGRRLLDSVVRRYADANPRHLQDDFLSTGRFRILVFATADLVDRHGISSLALVKICKDIIPSYPEATVELVVLHPFLERVFEWTDIPSCVKEVAEMRFHGPLEHGLYDTYGVGRESGAVAVVRPDGYVGVVTWLSDVVSVNDYLDRCLVRVS